MGSRVPRGPRTGGPVRGRHRPGVARRGRGDRGHPGGGPDRRMIGPHVTNSWPASLPPLALCPFLSLPVCVRSQARGKELENTAATSTRKSTPTVLSCICGLVENYYCYLFKKKTTTIFSFMFYPFCHKKKLRTS